MVSGVDSPVAQQNPLVEASSSVAPVNQTKQGAILNSSQLVVGKQFQAEVVSSLEDGTYIVKVADIAARMQLPGSPQIGTKLSLTLISTSPRATFLVNPTADEEAAGAIPTATNATLGASVKQLIDDFNQSSDSNATGLYLQEGANISTVTDTQVDPRFIVVNTESSESAPATLSSAGKLVNQLIQNTPEGASVVNIGKVPIVNTSDVNAGILTKALQSSVTNSGVFYESHLLQWAEGTLNIADLMKEPQASFSTPAETASRTAQSLMPISDDEINNPATISNALTANATLTLPKEATPLIQQQLQIMEQQRFVWHGELWPGQTMDWEISRDRQNQQHENPTEQTWQSAVSFELPQLGNIAAQLQLTGTHLRLTVTAQDLATASMLQNHAGELTGALENSGTQLDSLLIKTKEAE